MSLDMSLTTRLNGWGNYEDLVSFVEEYLRACRKFPEARVEVSR